MIITLVIDNLSCGSACQSLPDHVGFIVEWFDFSPNTFKIKICLIVFFTKCSMVHVHGNQFLQITFLCYLLLENETCTLLQVSVSVYNTDTGYGVGREICRLICACAEGWQQFSFSRL